MRMSVAENRKSGVDGAYHVEKPRHHHVHMPHVHMPHVHMPHVHMPHLHNPFHRKTHHDGEYDGEHDDDAHPKKVQRSKTFLQRMTSGMRSSTRASRVSRQASEDKETNLFPDAPSVNEEQVMPGAASSIRKSAQSPSAASATPSSAPGVRLLTSKRSRRTLTSISHRLPRQKTLDRLLYSCDGTVCTAPRWCARSER